jgi:peptide/nickel transport system substrate-binding protein
VKNVASGDIVYITLDAAGRSKNKAMTDQRVRKALMMAIDRDSLIKNIVPGAGTAEKLKYICFDWTVDCTATTQTQSYDPSTAKRLLAEAGFANGFDLQLDVHEPVREIAEAVAGELRKVGIRTSVQQMPLAVYVKKRGDGEFTAFMGFYPTSAQPDTANILDFFFGQDRDYYKDDLLLKAMSEGPMELDEQKRQALFRTAIDRVNEMNYIVPFSSLPTAYAMSKDVDIAPDAFSYSAVYLNDLVWAGYKGK